jgi:hypothetical protein
MSNNNYRLIRVSFSNMLDRSDTLIYEHLLAEKVLLLVIMFAMTSEVKRNAG